MWDESTVSLRQLSPADGEDVYDMLQHIGANENAFFNEAHGMSYDEYLLWLDKLDKWSRGEDLPEGYVTQWTYWLIADEAPVGYGKIRSALTPASRQRGGTIGYAIDERYRGKGLGTILMTLLIAKAKELNVQDRFLTVEKFNYASKAVIEKCGATLVDENDERWFFTA